MEGAADVLLGATRVLSGMALDGLAVSAAPLSLAQFRMLRLIEESGPISVHQAAAVLQLSESATAGLAGRLVVAGLIHWQPSPQRRRPVVAVTPRGRDTVVQVRSWRSRELTRILQRLSPAQRGAVADAMRGFIDAAAGAGYPGRPPASGPGNRPDDLTPPPRT